MKKTITLFLVLSVVTPLSIFAQNVHSSSACGTSYEDLHALFETMQENRARYGNTAKMRAVAYIPVALHLVAKSDGTGRISESRILDFFTDFNKTYEANGLEMQFYIKYINKSINDDNFYNKPSSFASVNKTYTYKKKDAINIFFCNDLGDGTDPNSVRLGYYASTASPNDLRYGADWLFIKNSEVQNGVSSTLEHEMGHFFSLPHTFAGWECGQFTATAASPCAPKTVACSGSSVENVARTGTDANCSTAADGFCDTPADYNFGFGWSDCAYKSIAKDPLCVAVDPDETNLMGYFTANCASKFSTEQKNAIRRDYLNNAARAYIRAGDKVPSLVDMTAPTLQIPANSATTTSYSNITFDWADVNGVTSPEPNCASGYIFEIGKFPSLTISYTFLAPVSSFNLLASNPILPAGFLAPNTRYYWRVRPYGSYKTAFNYATSFSFFTGTLNAVNDIAGVENFMISPNPVLDTKNINITLTSEKALDAVVKINNVAGQVVLTEKMRFETGINSKVLNINTLSKGLYVLTIEAENGVLNKKLVVAE
jgi:Secretion system C-terminal sorting domain/Pregnancy-associated plasma protein-A